MVVADGKAAPRPVKIGNAQQGQWIVRDGLAAGVRPDGLDDAPQLKVLGNRRDAAFANSTTQRQTRVTVGLFYTLLGQGRFGAVDWR